MSDSVVIVNKLNKIFTLISQVLSGIQRKHFREYMDAGEWGLALETLCDFLYEDELPLSAETYKLLTEVGIMLGIKSETWEVLAPQITGSSKRVE